MDACVRGSEVGPRTTSHRISEELREEEGAAIEEVRDLLQPPTNIRTSAPSSSDLSVLARSQRSAAGPHKHHVRLAYHPPASSTFLSEQTSHQQSASSTFLSEQISTSHHPPAK
jgi:hypothetical protein